jgi:hypothetical protein
MSFNSYDVIQTADYIQLSAESYLRRVFKSHAWETPGKHESSLTSQPKSPLTNEEAKVLYWHHVGRLFWPTVKTV